MISLNDSSTTKQGLLPQSIIGTSGLIFEGDSGIGKSKCLNATSDFQ